MKQKIEFRNPAMKQYEKQSGGMLPMFIVIVVLVLAGRYLFGAEAAHLPHVELVRYLPAGGTESLLLSCQPEATAPHFYCRVEKMRDDDHVAEAVIDEKAAHAALAGFFQRWSSTGPSRSTASGRKSLSWTVSDGEHVVSGESVWRDQAMEKQTIAVLSLEGYLRAELSR